MTEYRLSPKMIHVNANERPTHYPAGTIMIDTSGPGPGYSRLYQWNGNYWFPLGFRGGPSQGFNQGNIEVRANGFSTAGQGSLSDLTGIGAYPGIFYNGISPNFGMAWYMPISTPGAKYGFKKTGRIVTVRVLNPFLRVRTVFGSFVTNGRFWIGWTNQTADLVQSASPLDGIKGVLVGYNETDGFLTLYANDGQATTPAGVATTTAKAGSTVRNIDLWADDAGAKWWAAINNGVPVSISGNIPNSTTDTLYFHFMHELVAGPNTNSVYFYGADLYQLG